MTNKKDIELITRKFEALNAFARGAAHDINNILTSLAGNITLAQMYAESDPTVCLSKLAECVIALERAKKFTSNMVALTHGEPTLKFATSIERCVRTASVKPTKDSKITVEFDFPGQIDAHISEEEVERALEGIISNAVKATGETGAIRIKGSVKSITEATELPLAEGDYAVISISDDGPGISIEARSRIFDPYYSTDPRTKGRGLAYTYGIIKEQNGYIDVNSDTGKGATFHIYLPVSKEAETKTGADTGTGGTAGDGASVSAPTKAAKANLLLLSSEGIIQDLLEELLSPMGYKLSFIEKPGDLIEAYTEAALFGETV